jgi:hypothetical protein
MLRAIAWNCRLRCRRVGSRSCCDAWPDREPGTDLAGGGAGRHAARPGWLNRDRAAEPGSFAVCRVGLHLPQPCRQSVAPVAVGRQWRVALSAALASRDFCVAPGHRSGVCDQSGPVAVVGRRCRLATVIGSTLVGMASLILAAKPS